MGLYDLPAVEEGKNTEETVRNLFDAMYKFKRELEYLLENLDSGNLASVDGVSGVLAEPQYPIIESVHDIVNGLLKAGTGVTLTYDDSAGTLTIAVTTENIEDIVSSFIKEGSGVDIVYDDTAGTLTFSLDAESVQDIVNGLLVAGTGVSLTYDDALNTLTIGIISDDISDIVNSTIIAGKGISGTWDNTEKTLTLEADVQSVADPAAFVVTDGEIGGLTVSAAYDQLEVQALRDKCEALADDCRTLRGTVASLLTALKT